MATAATHAARALHAVTSHVAEFMTSNAADGVMEVPKGQWEDPTRVPVSDDVGLPFPIFVIFLPHLTFLVGSCLVFSMYFSRNIRPNEDKWARPNSIIPMSLRGRWQYGTFDCLSDIPLCCFALCCPSCTEAETWYRAGWSQTVFGNAPCQAYYLGCCMICCGHACLGCLWAFVQAALRGGFTQAPAGVGGMIPHDLRFGIPQENYIMNCILWCCPCTMICTMCQEYRQMQALVNHPEFVGDPVGVQMMQPGQMQFMPQQPGQMQYMPQQPLQGQVMAPAGQMQAPGQYPMQPGQPTPGAMPGQYGGQYGQPMAPGPMPGQMAPPQMLPMQGQAMASTPPPQWGGAGAEPFKG